MRDGDGRRYAYLCASAEGARAGAAVAFRAARSDFGYGSSDNVLADGTAGAVLGHAERAAAGLMARGTVPILSSEGWVKRAPVFARDGLLQRLGGGAHVVLFVRPPLDWLNAAWWQWGVWTGQGFGDWAKRNLSQARWTRFAREWAEVPGVAAVHVRLADRDVVASFSALFDLPAPRAAAAVNTTLPPALMAFLLRNRDLRPDPHASRIEFALLRALRDVAPPRGPGLWAMTPKASRVLWQRIALDREGLAALLPTAERARLEADPRWAGPGPYAERTRSALDRYEAPEALATLHDWLAAAGGAPPSRGAFGSVAEADAAIRALVLRLARPMRRAAVLRKQVAVGARLIADGARDARRR